MNYIILIGLVLCSLLVIKQQYVGMVEQRASETSKFEAFFHDITFGFCIMFALIANLAYCKAVGII